KGAPRFDDWQTANTGTGSPAYADRGAYEFKRNMPPVAVLSVAPAGGFPPLAVTADGSASSDSDGHIVSYTFDFGDGTLAGPQSTPSASHTFGSGDYVVILTVRDDQNGVDTMAVTVSAAANLVGNPSFETNTTGWNGYAGGTINRVAGGHDGAFCVEMTGLSTAKTSFGVNDAPNWVGGVTAGARYRFNAWVRAASATGVA